MTATTTEIENGIARIDIENVAHPAASEDEADADWRIVVETDRGRDTRTALFQHRDDDIWAVSVRHTPNSAISGPELDWMVYESGSLDVRVPDDDNPEIAGDAVLDTLLSGNYHGITSLSSSSVTLSVYDTDGWPTANELGLVTAEFVWGDV